MVGRRILVTIAVVAAALFFTAGTASPVPSNPGDVKDCSDFANWNDAQVYYETYAPYYGDTSHLVEKGDGIPCPSLAGNPIETPVPATAVGGYWMAEVTGTIFGFGDARPLTPPTSGPAISIAAAPGGGYWLLHLDGSVEPRAAKFFGSAATGTNIATSIAGLPDGSGYWVFTSDGRAVPFGNAKFYGDMSDKHLNGAIIASAVTPSGLGYWMVGSDGGIFSFGDAAFSGSTGSLKLNQPIVGIASDPDGSGYWLVAKDGGIFAFDAPFKGSVPGVLAPGQSLNKPVIGAIAYGDGYLMVASDGGIFSFSSRPFLGSLGANPPPWPIVGVAVRR